MTTPMPASPFQYDSMVVPSAMDESRCVKQAPASDAAAEIPGAIPAPGPAAVPFASPLAAAGDILESHAKEPEANTAEAQSGFGVMGSSRHVAGRTATTTSENLDVTGRRDAHTNSSFTAGGPQRALPAVASEPHETGGAHWEGRLWLVMDEVLAFPPIDLDPPLLFLETFPLNARVSG